MSAPSFLRHRMTKPDAIQTAVIASILAIVAYYFIAFLYIALSRIHYPFSLEWVEGESLIQVARILRGQMLYARPGYTYVALTYPPIYYYVSALVAKLLGLQLFSLRLVSLVASLSCMALIYLICRKQGTGILPSIVASGFFAAGYQMSGTWFDIARVDMLATALILFSVYLVALKPPFLHIAAGIVLALACLTKQTSVFTLVLLGVYFAILDRKKLLRFGVAAAATLAILSWGLDRHYSGWFKFYVLFSAFGFGASSSLTPSMIIRSIPDFWFDAILKPLPILLLFIAAYALVSLGFSVRPEMDASRKFLKIKIIRQLGMQQEHTNFYFYMFCAAGMVGTSWASMAHQGSFKNDLVPAFAIISILFGLSIQRICYDQKLAYAYKMLLLSACALQLILLHYTIGSQIPSRSDLMAGRELVSELQKQSGEVYIPFHPEIALLAGKKTYASWDSMYQLEGNYGGGDIRETQRVKAEFSSAMAKQEFALIILDKDLNWVWGHPEKYYYTTPDPVFSQEDVFWPVTGWQVRPTARMYPIGR